MTLIEVLAAIALLGVLLSATLIAIGKQSHQLRRAQDRIAALDAADRLLRHWLIDKRGEIGAEQGLVPGHGDWRWRVSGRESADLAALGAHVGRVEIVDLSDKSGAAPLASLEFVSTSATTAALLGQ